MASLPSTIKAIWINKNGDIDVIEELQLPFPQQKADEILVKVEYGGVNYVDTYVRAGLYPTTKFPRVLGFEASGTIVKLPSSNEVLNDDEFKLRGFAEGDRVAVDAAKLPASVDTKTGAAITLQGLTALTFVRESYEVKKGDTILVYAAAGGVGLILTQLALNVGATVIATVSTEEKAKIVRDLGAQHIIITSKQSTVDEVLRITNGEGVQGIFDGVGKDTFEDNFKIAARKGTIVSLGNASGAVPPFSPLKLGEKNLKLLRPRLNNYIYTAKEQRLYFAELFSLLETGAIRQIVHAEYPFTAQGVQQSQKDITSRGTIGKLLIKIT